MLACCWCCHCCQTISLARPGAKRASDAGCSSCPAGSFSFVIGPLQNEGTVLRAAGSDQVAFVSGFGSNVSNGAIAGSNMQSNSCVREGEGSFSLAAAILNSSAYNVGWDGLISPSLPNLACSVTVCGPSNTGHKSYKCLILLTD